MPSTVFICEDNGTAVGSAARGTTRTTGVSNVNWKNADDTVTAYSSVPIDAGNNSYEKFHYLLFSGSYNQISNGLFNHVSGVLGAGLTLKAWISGSGFYTTPSTTANAGFLYNLTATGNIATGIAFRLGGQGPELTGKGTSTNANPAFSEYFGTQLQTTIAASAGDTAVVYFQYKWQEN